MRGAKLITVNCSHCNRKIHSTIKQFLDGMECPGCGLPVTFTNEEQLGGAGNNFMNRSVCVNCGHEFDVSIQDSFKHLAQCPQCHALFIRDNMIMEESDDEEQESVRLLESLYPSVTNNQNSDLSDADAATPDELKFLADLNIKGNRPTSRVVQRIIKAIFSEINAVVLMRYNTILYFPPGLRSQIYQAIAQSELFRKIYFEDQCPKEELETLIRNSLHDEELFQALFCIFDLADYEIAVAYIKSYAKLIYQQDLDDLKARIMALRAFVRGWGGRIRHEAYFIYSPEENRVKNVTRLSLPAMRSFYIRHNAVNAGIAAMLDAEGMQRPPEPGCLGLIVAGAFLSFWYWCG